MTHLKNRATRAAMRMVSRARSAERFGRDQQARMADEYSHVLGLHLSRDEQVATFKRTTDGAPIVRRTARRVVGTV